MITRTTHDPQDISRAVVTLRARFTGAGAANPTKKTAGDGSGPDQYGVSAARSGAGVVVYTLLEMPVEILECRAHVPGAAPLQALVIAYSIANKTVSVNTYSPAGVATDLANGTDEIVIVVVGKSTNAD